MPTGLGTETFWTCPTLDPNKTGDVTELTSGQPVTGYTYGVDPSAVWTPDAAYGGTYKVSSDYSQRSLLLASGSPAGNSVSRWGVSQWFLNTDANYDSGANNKMYTLGITGSSTKVGIRNTSTGFSGTWVESSLDLKLEAYWFGGGVITDLKLKGSSYYGWNSKSEWDDYFNGWNHWYIELDFPKGSSGGSINYLPIENGYWRIYLNGIELDGTEVPLPNGNILSVANSGSASGGSESSISLTSSQRTQTTSFDDYWDDFRVFTNTGLPDSAEVAYLASGRGVEGSGDSDPVGLGGEVLWMCPSINDSPDDLSGSGNDGTYGGGLNTTSNTEHGGSRAYNFNGPSDVINTGSTTVHSNTLFTYTLWLKASGGEGSKMAMGAYDAAIDKRGPLIAHGFESSSAGDLKLLWSYQENGGPYDLDQLTHSATNVYDNIWHHVVCEFDGPNNQVQIYVDGVLDKTTTLYVPSSVNMTQPFTVGRAEGGTTTGLIDDVRVYDRLLSQEEAAYLATSRGIQGAPEPPTPPPSAFYNPFKSPAFYSRFFGNGRS